MNEPAAILDHRMTEESHGPVHGCPFLARLYDAIDAIVLCTHISKALSYTRLCRGRHIRLRLQAKQPCGRGGGVGEGTRRPYLQRLRLPGTLNFVKERLPRPHKARYACSTASQDSNFARSYPTGPPKSPPKSPPRQL